MPFGSANSARFPWWCRPHLPCTLTGRDDGWCCAIRRDDLALGPDHVRLASRIGHSMLLDKVRKGSLVAEVLVPVAFRQWGAGRRQYAGPNDHGAAVVMLVNGSVPEGIVCVMAALLV